MTPLNCIQQREFFPLSSEWEGGKISWQEEVRTYFSRYHLSCTRICCCCQGVADIWQTLFFQLSFFCPNGLPQSLLKNSSIFALKWGRSVALLGGRSPNPLPQQQQRNYHLSGNTTETLFAEIRGCTQTSITGREFNVGCKLAQSKVCSALWVLWCGVQTTPRSKMVTSLFPPSCVSSPQLLL